MFTGIVHILICLKFYELFNLGFCNLRVFLELVGRDVVNIYVTCPFVKVFYKFFEVVVH
jgi:hypothetical protein